MAAPNGLQPNLVLPSTRSDSSLRCPRSTRPLPLPRPKPKRPRLAPIRLSPTMSLPPSSSAVSPDSLPPVAVDQSLCEHATQWSFQEHRSAQGAACRGSHDGPPDDEEPGEEDQVDEADQDFSPYTFLSPNCLPALAHSPLKHNVNANRKKRKVPSPAVAPLAHPPLRPSLDYPLKSPTSSPAYLLPQPLAHPASPFGQLLRAAQLQDGPRVLHEPEEDEQEDASSLPPLVDVRDPVALAKALSSHYVKMHKKPIGSPRHYGRHLQKLALSRLLSRSPPSTMTNLFQPKPDPALASTQTVNPAKKNKPLTPSLSPRTSPAPRRTPKRKNQKPSLVPAVFKLKPPVLPNLYDPSLPINVPYPTELDYSQLVKSRSTHHGRELWVHGDHTSGFKVFPPPSSSLDHNRGLSVSALNHLNDDEDNMGHSRLRSEFSFCLEIKEINERLAALHVAIAGDKKDREAQIREAMKIAMMEQQYFGRSSGKSHLTNDAKETPTERQDSTDRKQVADVGEKTPKQNLTSSLVRNLNGNTSSGRLSNSPIPHQRPRLNHGPSGPPPSEPPPPLPTHSRARPAASASQRPDTPAGLVGEPSSTAIKKNSKKGKKKRSAHANANNIHHRDNYVPSRLPTTHHQTTTTGRGVLGTDLAPIDLLAQDYDPSGARSTLHPFIDPNLSVVSDRTSDSSSSARHSQLGSSAISKFFVEPDEWICGFCEYELWFGEELSLIKVIKNRKTILKRRSKAKDRAARAAAGIKNPLSSTSTNHLATGAASTGSTSGDGTSLNKPLPLPSLSSTVND